MCPLIAPALCLEAHSRPKSREGYPEQAMEISLRLNFRESEAGGGWGNSAHFREDRGLWKKNPRNLSRSPQERLRGPKMCMQRVNLHGVVRK